MAKMGMDLSKFKKVKSDTKSTILRHDDGHELKISHAALSKEMRAQMDKLPVHKFSTGGAIGDDTDSHAQYDPNARVPDQNQIGTVYYPPIEQKKPVWLSNGGEAGEEYIKSLQSNQPLVNDPNAESNKLQDSYNQSMNPIQQQQSVTTQQSSPEIPTNTTLNNTVPLAEEKQAEQQQPAMPQGSSLDGALAANQNTLNDIYKRQVAGDAALEGAMRSKKVDPDHLFHSMSSTKKLTTGIAMLLGGMGAAKTGGRNPAADYINNAINNDIDAQKNDQSQAMNLWKMHHQALGDEQAATLQTRNNMLQAAKLKMDEMMGNAPGPMAQQKSMLLKQQIDQEMAMNNYKMTMLQGSSQGVGDPAKMAVALIQDPGDRKTALEEIKNATNVSSNGPKIMQAFDNASKENTVMRTGAGFARTPGSVMALHQLMLPNFKTIDGTVRQAAMDESFHNLTPSPGDTDDKIAQKRQALQDWMRSESAAPVSRGHGIDLSKFPMTAENMPGNTVERLTPDGKTALFDVQSKKFLRYK